MKVIYIGIMLVLVSSLSLNAQKYITKTGFIRFYSDAPLEKIEATNRQVNAALDITSGDLVFKVLMKSFHFEKALMQEHFNESFVESDKYPNAEFRGKIANLKDISFTRDGTYNAMIEGKLTIHGITKDIKQSGTFQTDNGKILGKSKFNLLLSDFDISIPTAVVRNISNSVEVTVEIVLDKLP